MKLRILKIYLISKNNKKIRINNYLCFYINNNQMILKDKRLFLIQI